MAQLVERIRSVDKRILAVVAGIPAFACLCCFGIFFLIPTDTEPTVAVAQNTAISEPADTEEATNTAEPTDTTVPTEKPTETSEPTETARPSNTPRSTNTPEPTNTAQPSNTPEPEPSNTPAATQPPATSAAAPTQASPTNTPAPTQPAATNTAAPTAPPPTNTIAPTQPPPTPTEASVPGDVQITSIYYDGQEPQVEGDEYAVIQNIGGQAVNLQGWRLNAGADGQDFNFPDYNLEPGQSCRVYTNRVFPEYCGFSFNSGQALWNNGGDCGYLFDNTQTLVSTRCY